MISISTPEFSRVDLIKVGPYRIFFPLAILCGLVGVGHWLLWSVGWWVKEANGFFHASMMVGFMTFIVAGFLLTALPRFLGAPSAELHEVITAWSLAWGYLVSGTWGAWRVAESFLMLLMVSLGGFVWKRFRIRTKRPPDSFLLLIGAALHAVIGQSLLMIGTPDTPLFLMARQMSQVGFLLCTVLAVAGFLSPFLSGYTDPSVEPATRTRLLFFHAATILIILASFILERHWPRLCGVVRAGIVSTHLLMFAKIFRFPKRRMTYVLFFYASCWMIPIGLWASACFDAYRIAALHLMFIGGFSLMIFSFGTVVVLSHSAQAPLLNGALRPLLAVGVLALASMIFRVLADVDAWRYQRWIHTASGLWISAATTWLIYIWPKLFVNPIPEFQSSNKPQYAGKPG